MVCLGEKVHKCMLINTSPCTNNVPYDFVKNPELSWTNCRNIIWVLMKSWSVVAILCIILCIISKMNGGSEGHKLRPHHPKCGPSSSLPPETRKIKMCVKVCTLQENPWFAWFNPDLFQTGSFTKQQQYSTRDLRTTRSLSIFAALRHLKGIRANERG